MTDGLHTDVVSTDTGLGGGLPIGACLIGEKAQNVLGQGDHGSTFGGNPAVCAGAVSIVSRVTDELLEQVRTKGEMILETLKTAPGVREVTGRGLMIGILPEKKSAGEVVKTCMGHGVLCLTAKDRVRLLPALNIPEDLLKEALQVLVKALA